MATACPAPPPFRPAHGDPETTLRRFEVWYEGMQTYLLFARRLNNQGQPVDYDEQEKLRLALMIGGEDVSDILMYTGNQVIRGENAIGFTDACNATLAALQGNINETAAIHTLQGMKQNGDSITQYYQRVIKAARRINWADYTAEKAARDVITRGCDSDRLRLKALQDNPNLEDLFNTALSMENAQRKAKVLTTETEGTRRVDDEQVRRVPPRQQNKGANNTTSKQKNVQSVHTYTVRARPPVQPTVNHAMFARLWDTLRCLHCANRHHRCATSVQMRSSSRSSASHTWSAA